MTRPDESTMRRSAHADRSDGTREAILTAAERLFAENGVFAVSNRQVSDAAGGQSDDDTLSWLPQLHLTSWPEDFPLHREDMYGDDGR